MTEEQKEQPWQQHHDPITRLIERLKKMHTLMMVLNRPGTEESTIAMGDHIQQLEQFACLFTGACMLLSEGRAPEDDPLWDNRVDAFLRVALDNYPGVVHHHVCDFVKLGELH